MNKSAYKSIKYKKQKGKNMTELEVETLFQIDAKIGGNSKRKEILYTFIEPLNSFYLKKTEIYMAQIQACKNPTKYI